MSYPLVGDLTADGIPVTVTCRVLGFSTRAFCKWKQCPVSHRDWDDDPKNRQGIIALPEFAVEMLKRRRAALAARRPATPPDPEAEILDLVFPSAVWTLRDPQNVGHEWQRVRDALGIPDDITAHGFRGAVATIFDDAGLSARVTADVLMHVDPAMTQRRYMALGRAHQAAADALDRAASGKR